MPAAPEHKTTPLGYVMVTTFVIAIAIAMLCYQKPVILPIIVGFLTIGWILTRIERARLRKVAKARTEESICNFARSFPRKDSDPWLIRAVYEELQNYFKGDVAHLPLRASDRIDEDLRIDREDLDDIAYDIAHRAGYDMTDAQNNPLFNKVKTVADIVQFMTFQPKIRTTEPSPRPYGSPGAGSPSGQANVEA